MFHSFVGKLAKFKNIVRKQKCTFTVSKIVVLTTKNTNIIKSIIWE